MKSKESICTYLITNKDFRDLVISLHDKKNDVLEECIKANPELRSEINKARELIERMTFRKEQLQAAELDQMLEKILAYEKANNQKKFN